MFRVDFEKLENISLSTASDILGFIIEIDVQKTHLLNALIIILLGTLEHNIILEHECIVRLESLINMKINILRKNMFGFIFIQSALFFFALKDK